MKYKIAIKTVKLKAIFLFILGIFSIYLLLPLFVSAENIANTTNNSDSAFIHVGRGVSSQPNVPNMLLKIPSETLEK